MVEAKKIDLLGYFHTHLLLASVYGAMDRQKEGRDATAKLLELYPEFRRNIRSELHKWNQPDPVIDKVIRDLRRAGMEIPAGT